MVVLAIRVQVLPGLVVHAGLEAAARERRQGVRIRQVGERQSVVPAAGEEGVYRADELGQPALYLLRFRPVPAEERAEGEGRLGPVLDEAELLRAAAHLDAVEVVAPGLARGHAPQRGRPRDGGLPLGLAEVREAERPYAPVRSGELRGPLDGVVAVLELAREGGEIA